MPRTQNHSIKRNPQPFPYEELERDPDTFLIPIAGNNTSEALNCLKNNQYTGQQKHQYVLTFSQLADLQAYPRTQIFKNVVFDKCDAHHKREKIVSPSPLGKMDLVPADYDQIYVYLIREKLAKKGNGKSPILNIFYGSAPYYFNDPKDKLVTWQLEPTKEQLSWRFSVHLSGPYTLIAFGRLKSGAIIYDSKSGIIETPNPNTNHQKNVRNKTLLYQPELNHKLYAVDIIHPPNNAIVYPIRTKIIVNKIKPDFRPNTAPTTFINPSQISTPVESYNIIRPQDQHQDQQFLLPFLLDTRDYTNYEELGGGILDFLESSSPLPFNFNYTPAPFSNTPKIFDNNSNINNNYFQGNKAEYANQKEEINSVEYLDQIILLNHSKYNSFAVPEPTISFDNTVLTESIFDRNMMASNYIEDGVESTHHYPPIIKNHKMYSFDNTSPADMKKTSNRKVRYLNNNNIEQRYINNA